MLSNQKGFTLLESMLTLTLVTMAIMSMLMLYESYQKVFANQERKIVLTETLNQRLAFLEESSRMYVNANERCEVVGLSAAGESLGNWIELWDGNPNCSDAPSFSELAQTFIDYKGLGALAVPKIIIFTRVQKPTSQPMVFSNSSMKMPVTAAALVTVKVAEKVSEDQWVSVEGSFYVSL